MWWRTLVLGALTLGLLAVGACKGAPTSGNPPLVLERTIPLSGDGRIDHMALDARRHRLFVAELGSGALEAIDLDSGRSLARITGLRAPQGVGYLPAVDEVVVASGGDGSVRLLKATDLSQVNVVSLGDDADDVRVTSSGEVIVGYGAGGLARIEPSTGKVLSEVSFGAHPEGFSLDERRRLIFANVPDRREIAVLDLNTQQLGRSWDLGFRFANFPMALDATDGVVAVVFRVPSRIALFDETTGSSVARAGACADADDVYFDERRSRLYVSCGKGRVDTFTLAAGRRLVALRSTDSRTGARTSAYSTDLDRLYVAAPSQGGRPAALLVYRPIP